MGNLVAKNVEENFEQLCNQLVANDPRSPNGRLQWASPPFTEAEQKRLLECLGQNTSLKRLVLRDLDAFPDCAALADILQKHPALTSLGFFGRLPKENFGVLSKAFIANGSITELEFNTCILPPDTVDGIITILTSCKKISALRLRGCQIEPTELERLTLALQEASTLLVLEISLKPPITSTPSAEQLASVFKSQKSPLQDVSFAGFLKDDIPVVAKGAQGHATLQCLKFQEPAINDHSATAMGDLISSLPALLKLDLSNCRLSAVGGKKLAQALENTTSSTLRELYLSHNALGDDGTAALGDALKCCSNLLVLDVRLNKIGTVGLSSLAKAIASNPALLALRIGEEFVMPGRRFEEKDMQALADMLVHNKNLRKLYMEDASFHDQGMQLILKALEQNTTLQDWNFSCFSTASLRLLISKLSELHLKKIGVRVHGDEIELDEALGQEVLTNLRKNEGLLAFDISGLKEDSESVWKSLQPAVQNILANRRSGSGTKRFLDAGENSFNQEKAIKPSEGQE